MGLDDVLCLLKRKCKMSMCYSTAYKSVPIGRNCFQGPDFVLKTEGTVCPIRTDL